MAQDQFTQAEAQALIQKIMALVQAVWDNPNPGPREKALLDVTLGMLTLQNPIQTRNLVSKLRSAAQQGRMRTLEQVAIVPKAEFDLVAFILGDGRNNVPSWTEILGKVLEAAIADTTSAAPQPQAAPQQPKPQQTPPTPPQSPADKFGVPTQASTTPPASPTASTPPPPPPADPATPSPSGNGTTAPTATTTGGSRRRIR